MDTRAAESHGILMQQRPLPFRLHENPFTYVFKVGRVELIWSSGIEGALTSFYRA